MTSNDEETCFADVGGLIRWGLIKIRMKEERK